MLTFEEDGVEYTTIELTVPVELADRDMWTWIVMVKPRVHNQIREVWPYRVKDGKSKGTIATVNVGKAASVIVGQPIEQTMHVDHIDNNPFNNRWSNLRETTASENTRNRRTHGTSRFRGVGWYKKTKKWTAQFQVPGDKLYHLGYYDTEEEASVVYEKRRAEYENSGI